jgi:hypothetical protein
VVDTTPAMLTSCRPDGHLDYVNKGWLDYFGFSCGLNGQRNS